MGHFGARHQGGSKRKELAARGEGEGLLGMSSRTVFKKKRNVLGLREEQVSHVKRTEKPGEIQTALGWT